MIFLNTFKHLLPNAKAWQITIDKKLRQFFSGLASGLDDFKVLFDDVWQDIFPQTTRQLSLWENQFALNINSNLTEQQRRDRLLATWRAVGGQSPHYIQTTLRDNGFDVYVHEWWQQVVQQNVLATCGASNATCGNVSARCSVQFVADERITRNPFTVISNASSTPGVDCGEIFVECGEPEALCGNTFLQNGYLLVNKIDNVNYFIPNDVVKWKNILYIGGETFGDTAQVPLSRRNEFEALCLKICPLQQWLGMIVIYV